MGDGTSVLIILAALVVVLLINALIGSEAQKLAKMRGHDGKRYFNWSLLLG